MKFLRVILTFFLCAVCSVTSSDGVNPSTHYEYLSLVAREPGYANIGIVIELENVMEVQNEFEQYLETVHKKVHDKVYGDTIHAIWDQKNVILQQMAKTTRGQIENVFYMFGLNGNGKTEITWNSHKCGL